MSKKLIYLISFVLVLGLIGNAGGQLGLKASNPNPPNGATGWASLLLTWTPGVTAAFHDIYFGTTPTLTSADKKGRQPGSVAMYFHAAGFTPNTTYYWRIDEVETDGVTIHTGDVWRFTSAPLTAYNPRPADGRIFVDPNADLSWSAGIGAITHDVYFGTAEADVAAGTGGTFKVNQPATTYDPGPLAMGVTYYWRIDEVEVDRTTKHKGQVWRFKTKPVILIRNPNLVGWWKMDDVGTGTVVDFSGYGRNGTMYGNPTFVPGYYEEALELHGSPDYVVINGYKGVLGANPFSISAWIRTTDTEGCIVSWGTASGGQRVEFRINASRLRLEHGNGNIQSDTNVNDNEWHHVAVTVKQGAALQPSDIAFYLDGRNNTRASTDPDKFNITANFDVTIGRRYNALERWLTGLVDDVRIYDVELAQAGILDALAGDPMLVRKPNPADRSTPDIEHVIPLSWSPGEMAAKHDVYLGPDQLAVAVAEASDTTGIYRGRQDANSFTPPEALEMSQTYYWRVDEFNTDGTISAGKVWTFTVADYLVMDDMESYNDIANRIFQTWIDGLGYSEPAPGNPGNGTGSTVGNAVAPFAEQTIVNSGIQSMPFDYNNVRPPFYSETEMTFAVPQDWTRHGIKALTLWFRGQRASVGSFNFNPVTGIYTMTADGADIWGTSDQFHFAYMRLSGVGSIQAKVLSVSSTDPWAKAGVMIRETLAPDSVHADVVVTPSSGVAFQRRVTTGGASTGDTQAGVIAPRWVKLERFLGGIFRAYHSADGSTWQELGTPQTIMMANDVYIGLALTSHNVNATCTATFSNVTTTGTVTGQWQSQDIGIASNTADQLYVAVQDSAGKTAEVKHIDPNAVLLNTWQQWDIALKDFTSVNLRAIKKMFIGVGNRVNPQPGGSGSLFIDDIRLYVPRCITSLLKPVASLNDDCVVDYTDLQIMSNDWLQRDYNSPPLMAWYKFDGNANDSSGNGRHGTATGAPTYTAGKFGQAITLDGSSYVVITGYKGILGGGAFSITAWVKSTSTGDVTMVNWGTQVGGQRVDFRLYQGRLRVEHGGGNLQANTVLADGQWHHVAVTVTQNAPISYPNVKLYLDGKDDSQTTTDPSTFNIVANVDVNIGRRGTNNDRVFPGSLDDVRIYDKALSQAEIATIMDGSLGSVSEYHPLTMPANIYDVEPQGLKAVNLMDYTVLADSWLDEQLWPQP